MSLKTTCLVHNKGSMAIIIFMVNKFKWLMKYDWGFGICPFGLVLLSNCILLSVQCSYCIYYISIYAVKYYIFGLGIKGILLTVKITQLLYDRKGKEIYWSNILPLLSLSPSFFLFFLPRSFLRFLLLLLFSSFYLWNGQYSPWNSWWE